jgi:tetratricopeptide (TPR) repeat protein
MLPKLVKNTQRLVCFSFLTLLLAAPTPAVQANSYNDAVKTSYVTIRREAKFNSVIVAKKMRGERYRKVFEDNNWLKVEFQDGTTGWLFKTLTNRPQLDRDAHEREEGTSNARDNSSETKASTSEAATEANKTAAQPASQAGTQTATQKASTNAPQKAADTTAKAESKPQADTKVSNPKATDATPATTTAAAKPKEPSKTPAKPSLVSDTSLNAEDLYNKAIALYEKRQFNEALELNLMASKKAPKNAEILNNLGNCLFKLNRVEEALDYWYAALKVAPTSGKICNNIGIALYQIEKGQEAIKYYKKAIEFEPDFADSYYNLASAYGYAGDFKNAVHNYRIFLSHSPEEVMHKLAEDRIEYCEQLMQKK